MRIVIHVQALSGAGHFVRAFEIARALAEAHEVFVTDGGWPVPRRPAPVTAIPLPRLERAGGRLQPLPGHGALADVLARRAAELRRVVGAVRPDVVLVEHFPFSKWDLEAEYRALVAAARAAHGRVKVVCSVRDIVRKTRYDDGTGWEGRPYRERVAEALGLFDAVLVHSDPRFARVEEHAPWIGEARTPVHYTGFVSEKLPGDPARRERIRDWLAGRTLVVATAGGAAGGGEFLRAAIAGWRLAAADGSLDRHVLAAFAPLRSSDAEVETLARLAGPAPVRVEAFDPAFIEWLALARGCISRSGYNTCTNLLETRRRAVLVPDPSMSDQALRARRLAELGVADALDDAPPRACADAIVRMLGAPPPVHDLDLDGARRTRALLEAL